MSSSRESNDGGNRDSSRLNPRAMNFMPANRMSSKRKASSSATSGMSLTPSSPPEATQGQALISAEDLFGASLSPLRADRSVDLDDLDGLDDVLFGQELEDFDDLTVPVPVGLPARLRRHQRNGSIGSLGFHRSASTRYQSPRPAALLIQTGSQSESSARDYEQSSHQLPYLPLYYLDPKSGKGDDAAYTVLPSHANRIRRAANDEPAHSSMKWPHSRLPVELFELIASHLSRSDLKSMRLVDKEFEQKICGSLFRTSVVPFNTELYDMIVDETKTNGRPVGYRGKGKKKATDDKWAWRNAKEDKEGKVYQGHGLRVFQGFGPYIRRFGMSFEVSESSLASPPSKQLLNPVESYHGTYEWPAINYARFAKLNKLEETADETSRMRAAFSNLAVASELALSVRNGLGWLNGPDRSFYANLLQPPPTVFGSSYRSNHVSAKSARDVLSCLRQAVQRGAPSASLKQIDLEQQDLRMPLDQLSGLSGCFADTSLWPKLEKDILEADFSGRPSPHGFKILYANTEQAGAQAGSLDLSPNGMKKEQKEWLLETEWAQRAFLESYILAVMDNPDVSFRITTLNLATLSSGLLPMMSRSMFWDALPSLSSVIIHVSPDWNTVQKDEAGCATTTARNPSDAVGGLHNLLRDQIACRKHINSLRVGWADGGENAQGMFARNTNLLPAPLALLDQSTAMRPTNQLLFPYVEHLTLSNCWITPPMLEDLVNGHSTASLKKLTFDSVSLTTQPHPRTQAQQAQAVALAAANALPPFPQNPLPVLNGAGQMPPHMALAQHWQNQAQQMQQLFVPPAPPPPPQFINPAPANTPATGNNPVLAMPPPFLPGQPWFLPGPVGNVNNPPFPFWPHPGLPNAIPQFAPVNPTHWVNDHRQGCWPELLNRLSPGPIFTDYLPAPQPWEEQHPPRRETNLQTIEVISCGYARLEHNNTFDQTALLTGFDGGRERTMTPWFRARSQFLKQYMLDASRDTYLGTIVQWIPQRELDAMRYAWGLRVGWQDREKAEEAEFDGFKPGGTGRVSGVIEKGMPLMTHHLPTAWPTAQAPPAPGADASAV